MARRGWLGLRAVSNLVPSREPVTGLVLSGGGSKASFQLGALRYLYDEVHIAPTVVVGTSAGAVLGALLAQSADPRQQAGAVRELERLWLSMTRQSDMFREREWFRTLRGRGPAVLSLVQREPRPRRRLPSVNLPFTQGFRLDPEDHRQEAEDSRDEPSEPLSPEEQTLALATSDPHVPPAEVSVTQVVQLLAGLTRLRGLGSDLALVLAGAERTRSLYVPGPLLRELLGSGLFSASRVAGSGVTTRIAMVALETGELHFMREDGVLVDREDVEVPGREPLDLSRGVLASCSIPMVFAPVPLGGLHYVDGGIRENLPAEMAIGHLGCTRTFVVSSSTPGVRAGEPYDDKDMFSILMRSAEIQSDEAERDENAYARSAGAVVIEPDVDVHDALTIEPGLVRINRDHGWMRAAQWHHDATASEQALARSIIAARRRIWELERDHLDPQLEHDERDLLLLARLKFDVREQVRQLRPALLPPGAELWWQEWEGHAEPPGQPPVWLV